MHTPHFKQEKWSLLPLMTIYLNMFPVYLGRKEGELICLVDFGGGGESVIRQPVPSNFKKKILSSVVCTQLGVPMIKVRCTRDRTCSVRKAYIT